MKYDGMKIRSAIARREQSVGEFARDCNLSQYSVYRAIADSRASTKTLGKIANTLGVSPRELLKDGEDVDARRH